jgi:hypothetical protein
MDTRILSIIAILAFNFSTSFANTNVSFTEIKPVDRTITYLAPSAPFEAEFNEGVPEVYSISNILMPVTPKEATFDEETGKESIIEESSNNTLSPSAPKEAGFEENI